MTAVAKTCPPVKYGPLPFTPNKALPQISTHYYRSQKNHDEDDTHSKTSGT